MKPIASEAMMTRSPLLMPTMLLPLMLFDAEQLPHKSGHSIEMSGSAASTTNNNPRRSAPKPIATAAPTATTKPNKVK